MICPAPSSTLWTTASPARSLSGEDALSVGIVHSNSYRTYFDYDVTSNKYRMSQYSWTVGGVRDTVD